MPRIQFTPQLNRYVAVPPPEECPGKTVAQVLDHVFLSNPELKGYILDDQGRLRRHVAVFIDGEQIKDKKTMGDPVTESSDIFVMQALSGG